MTSNRPPPIGRPATIGGLALLCTVIAIPSYLIGTRLPPGEGPDVVADWLVTRAAVDGADPYANPEDLAERYGVDYRFRATPELDSATVSHPRTPGALVTMTPLLLLPPDRLHAYATATTMVCLALVLLLGCRMAGVSLWIAAPLSLLTLPTPPMILALHHGTQSAVVALLVTFGIWRTTRSDSAGGGLALGVATVLKVFPGLLLLPLLLRSRRRASAVFGASVVTLTLAGLAFPAVGPVGAFDALRSAGSNWITLSANGSFARVLTLTGVSPEAAPLICGLTVGLAAVAAIVAVARRGTSLEGLLLMTLPVALLWIPLSWIHYDLALLPVAIVAGALVWRLEAHIAARLLCVVLVGISFAPLAMDPGLLGATRRVVLAVTLLASSPGWVAGSSLRQPVTGIPVGAAPTPPGGRRDPTAADRTDPEVPGWGGAGADG